MSNNKKKTFLGTKVGVFLLTVIIYIAMYVIMSVPILVFSLDVSENAFMVCLIICAVPITVAAIFSGWQALSIITPDIFIIMPVVGWLIYFLIKLTIASFIGIFIFPYRIAKRISNSVENRAQIRAEATETENDIVYESTDESIDESPEEPNNIVYLTDEDDGSQIEFQLLDLIEYDNSYYVVLLPTDGDDCDEVLILLYESYDDQEGETYSSVDDENILQAVFETFKNRHKDEFNFTD